MTNDKWDYYVVQQKYRNTEIIDSSKKEIFHVSKSGHNWRKLRLQAIILFHLASLSIDSYWNILFWVELSTHKTIRRPIPLKQVQIRLNHRYDQTLFTVSSRYFLRYFQYVTTGNVSKRLRIISRSYRRPYYSC